MRKLIVSCNTTADGFMAGPGGNLESLSFIDHDPTLENDLADMFADSVDTIVVGSATYRDMAGYWPTAPGRMAEWLNATPKVVLSTDPDVDVSVWDKAVAAVGDPVEQVRQLKTAGGADVVAFGGVRTVRTLVAAGLVDEFWLKVSPIAIGAGESMFSELTAAQTFRLKDVTGYEGGSIHARYVV